MPCAMRIAFFGSEDEMAPAPPPPLPRIWMAACAGSLVFNLFAGIQLCNLFAFSHRNRLMNGRITE